MDYRIVEVEYESGKNEFVVQRTEDGHQWNDWILTRFSKLKDAREAVSVLKFEHRAEFARKVVQ